MHKRKKYLIYPPGYEFGGNYKVRYSKRQAWKVAVRMGEGAEIDVEVTTYPAPRKFWISCSSKPLWVLEKRV